MWEQRVENKLAAEQKKMKSQFNKLKIMIKDETILLGTKKLH